MAKRETSLSQPEWSAAGRLLAEAREAAGLSQSELARRLGRSQPYVWKIENGRQRVDLLEAVRYLDAVETDAGQFMRERRCRLDGQYLE